MENLGLIVNVEQNLFWLMKIQQFRLNNMINLAI